MIGRGKERNDGKGRREEYEEEKNRERKGIDQKRRRV